MATDGCRAALETVFASYCGDINTVTKTNAFCTKCGGDFIRKDKPAYIPPKTLDDARALDLISQSLAAERVLTDMIIERKHLQQKHLDELRDLNKRLSEAVTWAQDNADRIASYKRQP